MCLTGLFITKLISNLFNVSNLKTAKHFATGIPLIKFILEREKVVKLSPLHFN